MDQQIPLGQIICDFEIINSYCYFGLAVILTIAIRVLLTFFKAKAIKNGEIEEEKKPKWDGKNYWKIFAYSFFSNSKDIRVDDYWLPAIIGFAELLIFPILMFEGLWTAIIAWIAIKTASSWGGWQKTRTAYNRFLTGNILSLASSVFISWLLIK